LEYYFYLIILFIIEVISLINYYHYELLRGFVADPLFTLASPHTVLSTLPSGSVDLYIVLQFIIYLNPGYFFLQGISIDTNSSGLDIIP
jgi:hypothetical protein